MLNKETVRHNSPKIPYRPLRPMPDDFVEKAVTMTRAALERYYKCGHNVSARWYQDAGIAPPNPASKSRRNRVPPAPTPSPLADAKHFYTKPIVPTNRYQRDMSNEGLAADILQRDRWSVYRCNEDRTANPTGRYWMVGKVLVEKTELMERAARAARRMGEPIPWERAY